MNSFPLTPQTSTPLSPDFLPSKHICRDMEPFSVQLQSLQTARWKFSPDCMKLFSLSQARTPRDGLVYVDAVNTTQNCACIYNKRYRI
jgi:hypothetical protein